MKKIIFVVAIILILFSMFGCKANTYRLKLMYSAGDIIEIKIIELLDEQVYSEEDYTLLKNIDATDFADVYDDIQSIDYKTPAFTLSPLTPYGTSILIVYESGEYEIISRTGPQQYKYSEEYGCNLKYHSYFYCQNEELYDQIIDKWINADEDTVVE